MRDLKGMNVVGGGEDKERGIVQEEKRVPGFWLRLKRKPGLEVLGNAGIPLSRVDTGVFDACVATCLDITNDGLVGLVTVGTVSVDVAVVRVFTVVATRGMCGRHVAFFRSLGAVGS
jgi:hypothetical protein